MTRLTLRTKILLSYIILFSVFVLVMIPFANQLVKRIIIKSMDDQANILISRIEKAPTDESLVRFLKNQKPVIFFRVGLISQDRHLLYDSHSLRVLGTEFDQNFDFGHPEIAEAYEKGTGYHEEYSDVLDQRFAYYAKAFDFRGERYILRVAFPFTYIEQLLHDFEMGFLGMGIAALFIFGLLTLVVIRWMTRPIDQIIEAIRPYQEGERETVPIITLSSAKKGDDFSRLADTLNSMSDRIRDQIHILKTERQKREAILESLVEGVVAVDEAMQVSYINSSAINLLNRPREELIGKDFEYAGQEEADQLLMACRRDNVPKHASTQMGTHYVDLTAVPIKEERGAVLVIQDKTPEYKMEIMRKDFVANASHELKTPIQIILGYAEALHDGEDLPLAKKQEITARIVRNCERMNQIIKDLLVLSDVENLPESRLDKVNLLSMIEHCKTTLQAMYPEAHVSTDALTKEEPILFGDPYLLELAVQNLLNNAAKYSEPPAHITLTIQEDGDYLTLSVKDRGIGIPAADIENLFQRFYTVNKAHSRKLGGSGLGLSIVQTIIEKHGGSIRVESTLGVGSTFTLILPKRLLF